MGWNVRNEMLVPDKSYPTFSKYFHLVVDTTQTVRLLPMSKSSSKGDLALLMTMMVAFLVVFHYSFGLNLSIRFLILTYHISTSIEKLWHCRKRFLIMGSDLA